MGVSKSKIEELSYQQKKQEQNENRLRQETQTLRSSIMNWSIHSFINCDFLNKSQQQAFNKFNLLTNPIQPLFQLIYFKQKNIGQTNQSNIGKNRLECSRISVQLFLEGLNHKIQSSYHSEYSQVILSQISKGLKIKKDEIQLKLKLQSLRDLKNITEAQFLLLLVKYHKDLIQTAHQIGYPLGTVLMNIIYEISNFIKKNFKKYINKMVQNPQNPYVASLQILRLLIQKYKQSTYKKRLKQISQQYIKSKICDRLDPKKRNGCLCC